MKYRHVTISIVNKTCGVIHYDSAQGNRRNETAVCTVLQTVFCVLIVMRIHRDNYVITKRQNCHIFESIPLLGQLSRHCGHKNEDNGTLKTLYYPTDAQIYNS